MTDLIDRDYRGTIVDLRQGRGKKGELTHGRILRNSITHADGSKLTRMERASLPADGFFVHRSRCANGAFAEKSRVLFNTAEDGQKPMAVDVVLASVAVAEQVAPAQVPDGPMISSLSAMIDARPSRDESSPCPAKEEFFINAHRPIRVTPETAVTEIEDPFAHRDAEAVLVGTEAVLMSTTSKAVPSSETTMWAAHARAAWVLANSFALRTYDFLKPNAVKIWKAYGMFFRFIGDWRLLWKEIKKM